MRRGIPKKLQTLDFVCCFWNQEWDAVDFLFRGDLDYVLETLPTAGTSLILS